MKDREFKIGNVVRHFKAEIDEDGRYYYVIRDFAEHTETGEKMVVYQALYDEYKTYVRPYDMFVEKVDKDKYPFIKQEYRFERID